MILATCTSKNKKGNVIVSYTIKSLDGKTMAVAKEELKKAIQSELIDINNLRVSNDGKIVDREEGYYEYRSMNSNDNNTARLYYILRMRKDGTVYETKEKRREGFYLEEAEFDQAVQAKYVVITEKSKLDYIRDRKMLPINEDEYKAACISEDDYWKIVDKLIYLHGSIDRITNALESVLLDKLPRDKAIGFCKLSLDLHRKFYEKRNGDIPWWKAMSSVYGGVSDNRYSDYIYGLMGLGKEAYYDFYNNPTSKCLKKYVRTLKDGESLGYAMTSLVRRF